jgi:hypothetical protein
LSSYDFFHSTAPPKCVDLFHVSLFPYPTVWIYSTLRHFAKISSLSWQFPQSCNPQISRYFTTCLLPKMENFISFRTSTSPHSFCKLSTIFAQDLDYSRPFSSLLAGILCATALIFLSLCSALNLQVSRLSCILPQTF